MATTSIVYHQRDDDGHQWRHPNHSSLHNNNDDATLHQHGVGKDDEMCTATAMQHDDNNTYASMTKTKTTRRMATAMATMMTTADTEDSMTTTMAQWGTRGQAMVTQCITQPCQHDEDDTWEVRMAKPWWDDDNDANRGGRCHSDATMMWRPQYISPVLYLPCTSSYC